MGFIQILIESVKAHPLLSVLAAVLVGLSIGFVLTCVWQEDKQSSK